jgi:hypothetical protein
MNTSFDGGMAVLARREPMPPPGSALTTTAAAAPQTGPAAVPPMEASQHGARLVPNEEKERQAAARDRPAKAPAPPRTGVYDRRLTYENDQARTFLDVINPETDKLLMRMPPESLVEYLRHESGSDATAGAALNTRA